VNYTTGTFYWDEPYFTGGLGGTQRGFGNVNRGEGITVVRDSASMAFSYRYNWGSAHLAGANFLFADGSVRCIPYDTPPPRVLALLTPAGGEATPDE
jgi:prepilin-type processing-associated H-X9-DG protein